MNQSLSQRSFKGSRTSLHTQSPQTRIYNRYHVKRTQDQLLLEQHHKNEIQLLANTPKITPSSYSYLSSKIHNELMTKLENLKYISVGVEQINNLILSFVNEKKINAQEKDEVKILAGQLYLILCKYDLQAEPTFKHIFGLFRLLLDPYNHSGNEMLSLLVANPDFSNIQQLRNSFILSNPIHKEKTMKIQQILILFKKIRIKHQMFNKRESSVSIKKQQHTFRPSISQKSSELANRSIKKYLQQNSKNVKIRNSTSKHEQLFNRKLEKNKIQVKFQKDPQCTFQPNSTMNTTCNKSFISEEIVDRLYHVPIKSNKNFHQQQQEEELKKCTFQPRLISKSPQRSLLKNSSVKNYQKSVGRMAKARQQKQQLKQAYDNLGKVRNKSTKFQPPSMAMKQPKIILQIKIDQFRVQKLKIFGNENPKIVAKKFVLKYGLNQDMIQVVVDILNQYCSEYISCQSSQLACL